MINFQFEGESLIANAGQSVAAALLENQKRVARQTRIAGKPRGIFCGIGVCFDCLVIIDDLPNQRSCITEIKEGMVVMVQHGN
jgi:predicted molibdopterin-dependent oxidoreductase YjgC